MDGTTLYPIGELARRTGLTVKAIRFYSDRGIVVPADRSPAGYRLYGVDAIARLELVRTLRDLGVDLSTVRKVVQRELSLAEVARAHAEALAVQIRTLRLRRAVLTAVAERNPTPEEMDLMHQLAQLSERERRRLIDDFLDATFGGVGDIDSDLSAISRTMTPELPDNPSTEQVRAWVELAELSQDPEFRAVVRRLAEDQAAEREAGTTGPRPDLGSLVRAEAAPALEAGIDPASPKADAVVTALTAHYARLLGQPDDAQLRHRLLARLEAANDPRRERYFTLLAVINDWSAPESLTAVLDWSIQAVRTRVG
ncbi:MerR family transcriptional regulator [Streptomyces viridochromogenes]|uniref:MerR family transcriptional regulator n=1 Tax=Streptomyces viridochromogenes TaxID=1938 RepID=A0A0J7YWI3_STRVR|nr:MerR family transcriptional regulator [Streptomyces viridochromogenes]KMS67842.1 MerR family transcriptional regulator [Streptomyces viridochromogenes]KOG07345.1 MerR family transcriptional regulator [Streptomyces viridochromogenes]KOG07368.1 MerR family transcriptional regulator [Streptomyces viridochromogenes]